jgi:phage-related protein
VSNIETLTLTPRGNVTKAYDFGINTVEYENGVKQYQRKFVTPRLTLSFKAQGNKEMKDYLESFIVARSGNYEAFYWEYEGTKDVYRFSDGNIQFEEIRGYEGEGTIGYSADVSLVKCKEKEY